MARTVKYLGPLYEVELITGLAFVRGEETDVDDAVGALLIDGNEGPPSVVRRDDAFEEITP